MKQFPKGNSKKQKSIREVAVEELGEEEGNKRADAIIEQIKAYNDNPR